MASIVTQQNCERYWNKGCAFVWKLHHCHYYLGASHMSQRGMEFLMSLNSVLSLSDLLQSLDQYKSRQTVNVRYIISRHFPKHDYNRCQAVRKQHTKSTVTVYRVDCRLAPSQREMSLQSNAVFHWLGASLESTVCIYCNTHIAFCPKLCTRKCGWSPIHYSLVHWRVPLLPATTSFELSACVFLRTPTYNAFISWQFRGDTSMRTMPYRRPIYEIVFRVQCHCRGHELP